MTTTYDSHDDAMFQYFAGILGVAADTLKAATEGDADASDSIQYSIISDLNNQYGAEDAARFVGWCKGS